MMNEHREEDALRGQAVKNQKAIWDKTMEMRFLLQKAFSTSNKLPQESIRTRFCNHDKQIEQAYDDLLNSTKHTLSSMMELQEALLESNQATKDANEIPSASNGDNDEWSEVQRLQARITTFRNTEIDKWHRKIQVTTGAAALKGKLHAFNQNISDQVAGYMRDPSRMINRMYLTNSAVRVFGKDVGEPGTAEEGHIMEESAFYSLKKQQVKKRKLVDRRASKSRKIRYHVHEKITNFMAPEPMVLPPMAPKLFENLFGNSS
ncbi:protein AATF isoform X2 [Zea mays]|uniref:Protein AATF n=1 Tax=Zea mays TaxID=4577 RepID=A0A804N1C7_MAIZE|nr:protein AATF isoform X2 [Zea mays]|eukprot:XP_008672944.1 protein AATF isoform X2 [Zea mays]